MVKKLVLCFLVVFVLVCPAGLAEQIDLSYEGKCRDFNVTLVASDFKPGVYDVKVGIKSKGVSRSAGRIYDPVEGWKSSYYYVDRAMEIGNESGSVSLRIQADTSENITLVGKLRKDGRTWKSDVYEVGQDCPEPEPIPKPLFLLIVLIAIVVLLVGITYYKKER